MMTAYTCPRCGYETVQKSSIRAHYLRKKPCSPHLSSKSLDELIKDLDTPKDCNFHCSACSKGFRSRQSLHRHNKTCTKNDNITITNLQREIDELRRMVASQTAPSNTTTNNNTNTMNHITNIFVTHPHMNVKDFGSESIDHISKEYIRECLLKTYEGVKNLISTIHLNTDVPENHNVRFKSAKQKTLFIVKGGKAVEANQNTTLDKMIYNGYKLMYPEFQDLMVTDRDIQERAHHIALWFNNLLAKNHPPYYDLRRDILALLKENDGQLASTWETSSLQGIEKCAIQEKSQD